MSEPVPAQESATSLHNEEVKYDQPHLVIKNYCLEVAQLMFYPGGPFDRPESGIVWDPDGEKTQISIVDTYTFNLDQVALRPAIVAKRGPIQWQRASGFRQLQAVDFRTDRRTYTDLIRGSVTMSCFSRVGLEAERMAAYLLEGFQALRDVLRKMARRGIMVPNHLGFFTVESTSMGEEALIKAEARPELSVVPVSITARVQRRWSVEPTGRKLKQVVVRTNRT